MARIVVIGGGIAGLAAAHRLHRDGSDVTVLEAAATPGGVIRSEKIDGYLVEHGPNSMQTRSPELIQIIEELGLQDRIIEASDAAKVRYIVRDGTPHPVPTSPPALLATKLFSMRARLRILFEPFIGAGDPNQPESVAAFVRRRLGAEFLDYAINPFVAGVYAGDPAQLSLRHAFPKLFEIEQKFGSLIRGQLKQRRTTTPSQKMFSFDEGLETLVRALSDRLGERVRTGTGATAVRKDGNRWIVDYFGGSEAADAVIYCAPLHVLGLIGLPEHQAFERLRLTHYPPLSVVALGYRREDVDHPLDGFGLLVPEKEREFRILGTLFLSSIFSGRAPEGRVLLTSFVGGMRSPELAQKPAKELFSLVHADLKRLLGVKSEPVFSRHVFWQHAIPQYNLGYEHTVAAIDRLESALPGWFMAGNYRYGVAVGDAVASGAAAARRCLERAQA